MESALRATRAELESTLGELRGAMGRSFDWRSVVRRWPLETAIACVLIGLRLGRGRWL
jgi:hypothetical protein